MLTAILTVIPIFAVIIAGFTCGRFALLGPSASVELNRFVVYLALPALLFEVLVNADWRTLFQPGFTIAFAVGAFGIFGLTLAVRIKRGHSLSDAAIDGLNAGYANAGYIGIPLCETVFGREILPLATIAVLLTVCVLFAVALIVIEIGRQNEAQPHHLALKVAGSLARNPLLIAPVLGFAWSSTGLPLPMALKTFVHMLAGSATPCALVSLGLFLSARKTAGSRPSRAAFVFTGLKLLGQPALTAAAALLFRLSPGVAGMAVLMAALPTGTGPFMLAEYYDREAAITSHTILLSTAASVVSLAAWILLIK
ncbi:AEC family transporter [Bradyrhizobium sp. Tv2a-2]|uniref:AEC family transporter n=1 Tax=Bradyrhizobium sp. Tv2a-2 TaxID=113395 RepID=UPI0004077477|nr:AEC family transporter [Bradyrhizobium sp. Tv2a-2]